jgi:hypothetical protein
LRNDRDYDRLAEVMEFESIWLAPPGTLTVSRRCSVPGPAEDVLVGRDDYMPTGEVSV